MLCEAVNGTHGDEGINGYGSMFKGGENFVPSLNLPGSDTDDDDDDDADTEIEIEITTPRLNTPVFDALRQKYPSAFRRRTSVSSVCSDVSSVYSGSMIIGETRARQRRRQRSRTEGGGGGTRSMMSGAEGLPPRPPRRGEINIMANGESSSGRRLSSGGEDSDPRGPRGILKKDRNGYNERGKTPSNQNITGMSLKERLRRNREEMKALLSDENLPFKHKQSQSNSNPERDKLKQELSVLQPTYTPKESIRTLQALQNQVLSPPMKARSPRTKDGRTLIDHLKSGKHIKAKRFESPDSAHDSAVDMDSVSTQSNLSSSDAGMKGTGKKAVSGNLSGIQEDGLSEPDVANLSSAAVVVRNGGVVVGGIDSSSVHAEVGVQPEEEIVEPIQNARAPKLKSARRRGRSPSPLTVQNVNRSNEMMQRRNSAKADSDGDSGIAAPPGICGSVSSAEDVHTGAESVISGHSLQNQRMAALSRNEVKGHHQRSRSAAQGQPLRGPLRGDHGLVSPRSYQGDSSDTDITVTSAPPPPRQRALPPPPPPSQHEQRGRRTASADRRQYQRRESRGVTFEDEVYNQPLRQRSGSQPALTDRALYSSDQRYPRDYSDSDGHSDIAPQKRANVKTIHNRFHSDQDLRRYNARTHDNPDIENHPPQGRTKASQGHSRKPLKTAVSTEDLAAASVSNSKDTVDHAVHRASPVVVLPPKPTKPPRKPKPLITQVSTESLLNMIPPPMSPGRLGPGDMDITSEVSFGANMMEDINFDTPKQKKSKLPWKKNKGRYTPNEELEKMKLNILQSTSRSPSWGSLYSESTAMGGSTLSVDSSGKKKKHKSKGKSGTLDHHIPKTYVPEPQEESPVPVKRQSKRSASESPRGAVESPYEQVSFPGSRLVSQENPYEPVESPVRKQHQSPRVKSEKKKSRLSNPYEDVEDVVVRPSVRASKLSPRSASASGARSVELSPSRSQRSPQSSQDLAGGASSVRTSTLRRSMDFEENPYEDVTGGVENANANVGGRERPYEDVMTPDKKKEKRRSRRGGYEDVMIDDKQTASRKSRRSGYEDVMVDDTQSRSRRSRRGEYEDVMVNDERRKGMERSHNVDDVDDESSPIFDDRIPVTEVDQDNATYAQVDMSQKAPKPPVVEELPDPVISEDDTEDDSDGPPLPERCYGDLASSKHLSGSKSSLSERMGSFKDSARKTFGRLRRAISLERVNHDDDSAAGSPRADPTQKATIKKTPSLRSLSDKLQFKKTKKEGNSSRPPGLPKASTSKSSKSRPTISAPVDAPTHFRSIGHMEAVNTDGTKVVKLFKPPHGPFGFYIARGNAKFGHGIFISRLSDGLPEHFFTGLIALGDEILEINEHNVKEMELEKVYELMADTETLLLKTLPFSART